MSKITDSAKGRACQVRIPGVCNFNTETVVAAHIDGGGMGRKKPDLFIAYCCSSCHYALHHGTSEYSRGELLQMHYEGVFRTQEIMLKEGLVSLKGEKNDRRR